MAPSLISRRRAAELLDTSVSTIIRIQREGRLMPVRLRQGGTVYYRLEQVEGLLKETVDA